MSFSNYQRLNKFYKWHYFFHFYGWVIFHCVGFLGGTNGKEPACQCRRYKRWGFDPWVRKIPWRRAWQPIPVFLPGESYGQRSLAGGNPWGCKESDTTKQLTHTHTIMFKEGKETISKELNKRMRIMSQQIENNNKEIEIIKTHQIEIWGWKVLTL